MIFPLCSPTLTGLGIWLPRHFLCRELLRRYVLPVVPPSMPLALPGAENVALLYVVVAMLARALIGEHR